jgi:hypothetical protein
MTPWDQFISEEFESEDHNLADYSPRELLEMFFGWLEDKGAAKWKKD